MANTPKKLSASANLTAGEDIDEKGIMIAIKSTDSEAYKAADTANLTVVGVNDETASEDDTDLVAKSGIYGLDNSSTYPVSQANIGSDCYVEDESTVSTSGGSNNIVAGKVVDVDSNYVWVKVGV
jgi:hypothetical protein